MAIKYPLVHITVPSGIINGLMQSYIVERCKRTCVFVEDLQNEQINGNDVIVVCDWYDFVAGKVLQGGPEKNESALSSLQAYFIVINMVKGEEEQLGASPYLGRIRGLFYIDDTLETFRKGFTAILNEEIWVPRAVLMTWMTAPGKNKVVNNQDILSSREESVLKLMAGGMSNKEISKELYISANTVKAHLYNIYKKIEVSNRLQAARWASTYFDDRSSVKSMAG